MLKNRIKTPINFNADADRKEMWVTDDKDRLSVTIAKIEPVKYCDADRRLTTNYAVYFNEINDRIVVSKRNLIILLDCSS